MKQTQNRGRYTVYIVEIRRNKTVELLWKNFKKSEDLAISYKQLGFQMLFTGDLNMSKQLSGYFQKRKEEETKI